VKDVDSLYSLLAGLFVAKHEVDPARYVLGDVVGLEGLAVDEGEQARVVAAPRG